MAAIVPKAPHVRTRSTSDPFSDPVYASQHRMVAAPRPPTGSQTPTKPSSRSAVPASDSRAKMHRSQTSANATQDSYAPQAKRTVSQDSVGRAPVSQEKSKHGGRRGKKGSVHADVIDRLDFSGVGPMFHHDGPFDACAPSRNKNSTKAPMKAWGADYAAQDERALARARQAEPVRSPRGEKTSYTTSPVIPYEAPKKAHDALAEAWGIHEPEPFEEFSAGGGMHSRGSTRHNTPVATNFGTNANSGSTPRRSREQVPPPSSAGAANAAARHQARREHRAQLPPPQPIFVDDNLANSAPEDMEPSSPTRPGAPKRSKSLMQRIRKMRDNPNVPAGSAQDEYIESDAAVVTDAERPSRSARPTHRAQMSFMGRTGGNGAVNTGGGPYDDSRSPRAEKDDQFVYVEKDLPSAPGARSPGENAYFDETYNGVGGAGNGGAGLGRKTSLMKRAKGLMRGGK